jgi:AcrR family transcriptional regulator
VATRLLREGRQPTVAEVADAALISRATAYRYLPTQEALLLEITDISPAVAPVEACLAGLDSANPLVRLQALLDALNRIMLAEETSMRTSLRIYLDTWLAGRSRGEESPTVREGRRMRWIDDVLAPVRRQLGERSYARVRAALAEAPAPKPARARSR